MEDFKYSIKFEPRYNPELRRKIEIIDIIIVLVILAISIFCLLAYNLFKYQITSQILFYGSAGIFLSSAFLEFIPQVLNPFLVILAGIASGIDVHLAVIFGIFGSFAGAISAFYLGRMHGFKYVSIMFDRETFDKVMDFFYKHGKIVMFISAITPLPYLPLVFGALQMKWRNLLWWGIIPRALSFVLVGYGYYFGLFQYNL